MRSSKKFYAGITAYFCYPKNIIYFTHLHKDLNWIIT